jgi:hypothetical protein
VKAARESARLTQAAAARTIDTSIDNWQRWELGRYRMLPGYSSCLGFISGTAAVMEQVGPGASGTFRGAMGSKREPDDHPAL